MIKPLGEYIYMHPWEPLNLIVGYKLSELLKPTNNKYWGALIKIELKVLYALFLIANVFF